MKTICTAVLFISFACFAASASSQPTLKEFLQGRLASSDNTEPPSHDGVLAVIYTVAATSPAEIQQTFPVISEALKRDKNDIAVEAVFALHAIADFVLTSLQSNDAHVKQAAIRAVNGLSLINRTKAQVSLTKLSTNPEEDEVVRRDADRSLHDAVPLFGEKH